MAFVGVVTGLTVEAQVLADQERRGNVKTAVAGADEARAAAAAERLADAGAAGLVSFGICGGLIRDVRVGDLVLASAVLYPNDDPAYGGSRYPSDVNWHAGLRERIAALGIATRLGPLVGSRVLVERPADKTALSERYGAAAVDMESHAVARVAADRGLPFLVVRSCSDAAERRFPIEALEAMSPDGSFRVAPVMRKVAAKPWVVPGLITLAWETRAALSTLKKIAAAVDFSQSLPDRGA